MCGARVLTAKQPMREGFSDVVLLDLDSAAAPDPKTYRRMIGFTRGESLSDNELRRQCSLVLHRPFAMRLLRREVLSDLDRAQKLPIVSETADPALQAKRVTLDTERAELWLDGQTVALTPNELRVAQCLLSRRGLPVSREELAEAIGESSSNKTEVYVCYLRQKLEKLTSVKLIRTVRNKGYLMV